MKRWRLTAAGAILFAAGYATALLVDSPPPPAGPPEAESPAIDPPPVEAPPPRRPDFARPLDLGEVVAAIGGHPDHELYPDRPTKALFDFAAAGTVPQDAEEEERVLQLFDAARRHAERLAADPAYYAEWRWRAWLSRHPLYEGIPLASGHRERWLVFVERGDDEAWANRLVEAALDRLVEVDAEFRRQFTGRLILPEPRPDDVSAADFSKVLLLSEATARARRLAMPEAFPDEKAAPYQRRDRWLVDFYDESGTSEFLPVAAVHRLVHEYSARLAYAETGTPVSPDDPRIRVVHPWLVGGFSRLLFEPPGPTPHPDLIAHWRNVGPGRRGSAGRLEREVDRWDHPSGDLSTAIWSWAFCSFLWRAEDGRRRDALVGYVGDELVGRGGRRALERRLFPSGAPDWGTLEAEFVAWMADPK